MLLNNKARAISFSGIVLAFNLIVFALLNIIPINTVAFMVLASLFPSVIIMEYGNKYGFIYSLASVILGFFIISNKIHFLTYLFIFAFYGLVKSLIEKNIKNTFMDIFLKQIYATILAIALFFVSRLLIVFELKFIYILAFEIAFFVYDYFYSIFIKTYIKKLRKYLKLRS
ncbi:hypothetical protein HLB30_06765 [Peptostreptococcus russellii]|uniref:hypothetical protein n=1 Tax=Peptostreptococcus russellii TaxID=215200 RepID=UPI0016251083|nr:hypothetical protein [Peptostreptococcus russellii]MBC2578224.1 hypothetical protein [Peptostreptococcus russellii]